MDTFSSVFVRLFTFFYNATATTEIYTLSLHDALPIFNKQDFRYVADEDVYICPAGKKLAYAFTTQEHGLILRRRARSEEHTSELQSHSDLVCRLLLEKKKQQQIDRTLL